VVPGARIRGRRVSLPSRRLSPVVCPRLVHKPAGFGGEEGPHPSSWSDHGRIGGYRWHLVHVAKPKQCARSIDEYPSTVTARAGRPDYRPLHKGHRPDGDTSDGKKRLEIRIGGIYALEQIAQDSVQYYGQIMEILTAYLRENSPWPPKDASVLPSAESKVHKWTRWRKTETISFFSGAATDVQAVLDVLGRREEARVPITYRVSFDLTETDLQGANLVGIDLAGASLVGANLQGAWLVRANLEKADLTGANLQQAWLSGARLTRARLTDARLEGAHLSGATISDPPLQLTRIFGPNELSETGSIRIEASDLSETLGLVEEQLGLTVGDLFIKVPQGFQLPSTWALNPQEQIEIIREQMIVLVSNAPDDY
jgi:hypothetical protein